ncbi:37S ribosomal protein rsm22 [Sporothrix brasiliensis 5110]|uniref:37S ribosomal protein rsm22 n=1 Tax=Sporothrix brasiliensis 5110 TaxID=1398154 RepID=A0A0C2IX74_9PEZI|nr:37S ribosomal protein rsm22 [Sporothrix brasiliensis 5110]KIH93711.1 37S ribosomal protein rsm22 [Sporothrix brasiliensis 5110]
MYKAKELQRACPRSQAWLRQALASGLIGPDSQITKGVASTSTRWWTATARQRPAQQQRRPSKQSQLRPFSTSRTARQHESQPDAAANTVHEAKTEFETQSPADMEKVVREARATFGDTLPEDFLSDEEYSLYQRLYGTPLRQTQPEDVGIPDAVERQEKKRESIQDSPLASLVRETKDGNLEVQFVYDANVTTVKGGEHDDANANPDAEAQAQAQAQADNDSTGQVASQPATADPNVKYIQARARSERQYVALTKLQRDFEAARIVAEQEDRLRAEQDQQDEVSGTAIDEEADLVETFDEAYEEAEEDDDLDDEDASDAGGRPRLRRIHPLTERGRSRTVPRTIQLPKASFVEPITELLKRAHHRHLQQSAFKVFGGPDLPHSPRTVSTPTTKKRGRATYAQLPVAMEAGQRTMRDIEADAYLAAVLPFVYATATSTLVEVRRRLGSAWIENLISKADGSNPRVLDVGGGGGALAAWNTVFRAELAALRERGRLPERQLEEAEAGLAQLELAADEADQAKAKGQLVKARPTKSALAKRRRMERTVVVGSDELRLRLSKFLHDTTFLPRLPDLLHSAENVDRHLDAPATPHPEGRNKRKTYDVIIASHLLLPHDRPHERHAVVSNLWAHLNPDGGVLIILERGHPRGFEAVADARQQILDKFMAPPSQGKRAADADPPDDLTTTADEVLVPKRDPGMIVAPCTSHGKCPMYLTAGVSEGRKDYCHFSQRFNRPPFLQRILGSSHHNHEDVEFTYVAVQRGTQKAEVLQDRAPVESALSNAADTDGLPLLPPTAPLVQGKEATDAAFRGFENVWSADANAPPPPADAVSPHPLALPRTIMPALKRQGHVILDVCTPAGQLERWTVPRSRSKQAYHDARKARWGDLWALGAKTRVPRSVRLGRQTSKTTRTIDVGLDGSGEVVAREQQPSVANKTRHRQRDRAGKFQGKARKVRQSRQQQADTLMKELKESVFSAP